MLPFPFSLRGLSLADSFEYGTTTVLLAGVRAEGALVGYRVSDQSGDPVSGPHWFGHATRGGATAAAGHTWNGGPFVVAPVDPGEVAIFTARFAADRIFDVQNTSASGGSSESRAGGWVGVGEIEYGPQHVVYVTKDAAGERLYYDPPYGGNVRLGTDEDGPPHHGPEAITVDNAGRRPGWISWAAGGVQRVTRLDADRRIIGTTILGPALDTTGSPGADPHSFLRARNGTLHVAWTAPAAKCQGATPCPIYWRQPRGAGEGSVHLISECRGRPVATRVREGVRLACLGAGPSAGQLLLFDIDGEEPLEVARTPFGAGELLLGAPGPEGGLWGAWRDGVDLYAGPLDRVAEAYHLSDRFTTADAVALNGRDGSPPIVAFTTSRQTEGGYETDVAYQVLHEASAEPILIARRSGSFLNNGVRVVRAPYHRNFNVFYTDAASGQLRRYVALEPRVLTTTVRRLDDVEPLPLAAGRHVAAPPAGDLPREGVLRGNFALACWHGDRVADRDNDGFPDDVDTCVTVFNPDQDAAACAGDPFELDPDGDGLQGDADPCPFTPDPDGDPEACAVANVGRVPDADYDGVPDFRDNCPTTKNPRQHDLDRDGVGDDCAD